MKVKYIFLNFNLLNDQVIKIHKGIKLKMKRNSIKSN